MIRLTPAVFLALMLAAGLAAAQPRSGPFNQPPRSLRTRTLDQRHVRLELSFDFDQQQFRGRAIHRLSLYRPAREIELDAADMKIERVTIAPVASEGERVPTDRKFTHRNHTLTIDAGEELAADREWELAIDYAVVKPRHGAHFVAPDPRRAQPAADGLDAKRAGVSPAIGFPASIIRATG